MTCRGEYSSSGSNCPAEENALSRGRQKKGIFGRNFKFNFNFRKRRALKPKVSAGKRLKRGTCKSSTSLEQFGYELSVRNELFWRGRLQEKNLSILIQKSEFHLGGASEFALPSRGCDARSRNPMAAGPSAGTSGRASASARRAAARTSARTPASQTSTSFRRPSARR